MPRMPEMQLKHKDTREGILKIFRLRDFSQIAKIAKLSENIRYRCISMTCAFEGVLA